MSWFFHNSWICAKRCNSVKDWNPTSTAVGTSCGNQGQASEITWNQSMMQIPIVGRSIANPQENSCKCCFQSFEGWSRYSSSNYFYNGDLPTTNHEDIPREKQTRGKRNTQFCKWKVSLQTANGRLVSGQFKIRSNTMSPFPCSSRWGPTSSHESG